MEDDIVVEKNVSKKYLTYREQLLNYTNLDMNLTLDNNQQVYIALFDIPIKSNIVGFQTQSLGLVFGLNTHIYHGSGVVVTKLEQHAEVMKAMQSVLISSHQALSKMTLIEEFEFYNSEHVRVYLKTEEGIYFKELSNLEDKIDKFLLMLMNHILLEITKTGKLDIR